MIETNEVLQWVLRFLHLQKCCFYILRIQNCICFQKFSTSCYSLAWYRETSVFMFGLKTVFIVSYGCFLTLSHTTRSEYSIQLVSETSACEINAIFDEFGLHHGSGIIRKQRGTFDELHTFGHIVVISDNHRQCKTVALKVISLH